MIMDLDIHVVVLVVWLSIGLSTSSVLDSSVGKRSLFQCGDKRCTYSNEVCRLYNTNGQLNSQCVLRHSIPSRADHDGCPKLLGVGYQCFCNIHNCDHQTQALLVKAGGGGGHDNHADHIFFCLTSQCFYDHVCRLRNTNGHLIGHCISKHAEPHYADHDGCPQLLGEGSECFCNIHNCDHHTQAATGHHTTTTTNHNDLVCGGHVCHGHQYCIIEEKQDGKLHFNCADVHNTQHCLPNLLSNGSLCFCDTRICVDHTLISIVAGHQVAGLICSDYDDHSCPADYVCEISMDKNGIKKHCGNGHHMTQCTQLPIYYHEKCYCATQSCVFGQFSATTTMSITSKLTTAGPTVAASTTIQQTTVQPTMVQVYTSVPTTGNMHVIPSNASITLAVANTPTIQAASTVLISSLKNTCSDDEDTNFSCIVYEMKYSLCTATTGTLYRIAHKRCQAYCGICSGNSTSVPQQASLPTQPTCIDHDARCSQYQQQICSSTVSKNYVISTCPKSCNKCAEYLG
ncbi:uncharacterized protein LOC143062194 [Mytilus galloprovincialis]|uniref:uncharacterized protein LOC143062194 n=1 Tax=Mytilus galloprovincialis TaxID=29158 RepID=UPI003F7C3D3C